MTEARRDTGKQIVSAVMPVLVVGALGLGVAWFIRSESGPEEFASTDAVQATSRATLDPTRFSDPILSGDEAIARTLDSKPQALIPTEIEARLINIGMLDEWRGSVTPFGEPHAPVWLVGLASLDVAVSEVFPLYQAAAGYPNRGLETAQGVYFAWDANSGASLGMGVLGHQWPQTFDSLIALEPQPIPIVSATEIVLPVTP